MGRACGVYFVRARIHSQVDLLLLSVGNFYLERTLWLCHHETSPGAGCIAIFLNFLFDTEGYFFKGFLRSVLFSVMKLYSFHGGCVSVDTRTSDSLCEVCSSSQPPGVSM